MKKKKLLFFPLIYFALCLHFSNASPKINLSKEVSITEASLVFIIKRDSTFQRRYEVILNTYSRSNYTEALSEILELEDSYQSKLDYKNLYLLYSLKANIYNKTNNHSRALENFKKALKNLLILKNSKIENNQTIKFNKEIAKTYLSIGSSFYRNSNRDSAKFYYLKVDGFTDLNNENQETKALSYINLSGIYEQDSIFDKAINYAEKAIEINRKINFKLNQASAKNNLGNIYLSMGDFEKAKEIYNEGINLIKNDKSPNAIRYKAKLYYNLAWAMRNLKDYKAYDFQEISYEIEDGIRDKEIKRMVEEITTKNNVEDVKRIEENKRLIAQRTFTIYGIGSFVIIISLLYFLNFYKLKQKNLSLELSQTQLLQNQNIEKIKSESQIRILNATIDGKETERKEIAETLHDSVSALLSSANLHLMATNQYFNGNTPLEISKTQEIIKEASQKIRDLSHTLVSSVLLKFGLNFAVKDLAAKYSNSNLNIETETHNIRRYEQNFEIKIYNIIQEFLNNILKHSKAKNTVIKLQEKEGAIVLQISDDGVGFDTSKITNKDGLGLNQIEARIHVLKGNFSIDSKIDEGTSIIIKVPVLERTTVNHV
ncbi:tetratricopeptide repeat-containing sensor histidine kinase [uncultured Polaribacter sp.]|uniref:tetratricopeptide repeat-containing sensor histidine kinase n=1 Tax=uncultured Polaribacter sp. TaxID=174711 RepID=UPI00261899D2|nr:tetratricopeptide repeat-containing sensor histidine kinase [uncultured Polaribacter sp.]